MPIAHLITFKQKAKIGTTKNSVPEANLQSNIYFIWHKARYLN